MLSKNGNPVAAPHLRKMAEKCTLCTEVLRDDPEWFLQCSSCDKKLHYSCGMGYEEPVKAFRTSQGKQQYLCPICIVAKSYDNLHLALKRHEAKSREINSGEEVNKNDTDSHHSDSMHSQVTSEHGAVESVHEARPRSSTLNSAGEDFIVVVSPDERRRISRCKKVLYGLKHVASSVDTVILLDSNGRNIKSKDIDGGGDRVCFRQVGGLCVSATTCALKECKVRYPKIKHLVYGLGTNDHLHAHEHLGERTKYIKELDQFTRKVFPNAQINFILPFSAIEGLGDRYTQNLAKSISVTHVGWKIHTPPSMKSKLMSPDKIHINPSGRVIFTLWLRKVFAPIRPAANVLDARSMPTSTPSSASNVPSPHSYSAAVVGNTGSTSLQPPSSTGFPPAPAYSGLAREVCDIMTHMMNTWRREPVNPSTRLVPPQWAPIY